MKHKLATTLLVVAALSSRPSPGGHHRPPGDGGGRPGHDWPIEGHGPGPDDNVILKWDEQLLQTIRENPRITGRP